MKIIKKGTINYKKAKIFTCPDCGCIFEAIEGEEYKIKKEEIYGGYIGTYYIVTCPYCFKNLVLQEKEYAL